MRMKPLSAVGAVLLTATLMLGACSSTPGPAPSVDTSSWDAVVSAAEQEGQVTLYAPIPPAKIEALLAAFNKEYPGIKADYFRDTSGPLTARVDQEIEASALGADVVWTNEIFWNKKQADDGLLLPVTGPASDAWKDNDVTNLDAGLVNILNDPIVIVYNTDLVTTPPVDWDSLLDSEYAGAVGVIEVQSTGMVTWYKYLEDTQGSDFLPALAKQKPQIYPSLVPMAQAVAAGEIKVGAFNFGWVAGNLKDQNAPIDYVIPESGTTVIQHQAMAYKQARHPNAGLVLLDFLMSEEAQEIAAGNQESYSQLDIKNNMAVDPSKLTASVPEDAESATVDRIRSLVNELFVR